MQLIQTTISTNVTEVNVLLKSDIFPSHTTFTNTLYHITFFNVF